MKLSTSNVLILAIVLIFSQGCTSTKVNSDHFMLAKMEGGAEVYFIRPATERPLGMGDNTLEVDIEDEPLLILGKKEFVGVRVKPGNMDVFVKINGRVGHESQIKQLTRKERFSFKDQQRHFIFLKKIDNEFRGLGYAPVEIGAAQAELMIKNMKPVGVLAKQLSQTM